MEFILEIFYLKKIKDGALVINLDECSDIGTHWVALYALNNNITYFDSFGAEHIPKEIKRCIANKNMGSRITKKIFRIQAYFVWNLLIFCLKTKA